MSSKNNSELKAINTFYNGEINLSENNPLLNMQPIKDFIDAVSKMNLEEKQNYVMIITSEDNKEQAIKLTVQGRTLLSVYLLDTFYHKDNFKVFSDIKENYGDFNQQEALNSIEIEKIDKNSFIPKRITLNNTVSEDETPKYKQKVITLDTKLDDNSKIKRDYKTTAKLFYLNKTN
jgi:hypothetical protein